MTAAETYAAYIDAVTTTNQVTTEAPGRRALGIARPVAAAGRPGASPGSDRSLFP